MRVRLAGNLAAALALALAVAAPAKARDSAAEAAAVKVLDAFMAAFASATSALHCAVDIQRALADYNRKHPEWPMKVRIGLNSGESIQERNDYFGTAVTVATRITHKARGGQILVSGVVRDLAGSMAEVSFRDAGRRQLKGIPGRQRLDVMAGE